MKIEFMRLKVEVDIDGNDLIIMMFLVAVIVFIISFFSSIGGHQCQ